MASYFIQLPVQGGGAGGVESWDGRTGIVLPASGDYTASEVTFVPAAGVAAVNVQAAIEEVAADALGGNVVGPASATTLALARFDGTTGKLLKNSLATLSDNGALTLAPNADAVQWKLTGNATQTNLLSRWENSSNTLLASVGPTGFIGVGPNVPKAALHVGPNTTSGTVGTGALILGKCDTTQNIGAYSTILGGSAGANYCIGTDSLVGGAAAFAASGSAYNIFWGVNVGTDNGASYGAVFGADSKVRALNNFSAGGLNTCDFGSDFAFILGTRGTASAAGASLLLDGAANNISNAVANSLLFRQTGGWRRVKTATTSASPIEQTIQDIVSTTDATVTTLQSFTTASNTNYMVECRINARRTGGASGAAGDGAGYILRALVKNIAGTVTINGLQTDFSYEDQAGWDATIDASGTAFRIRVTGATDNNITWTTTTTQTIL